MPLDRRTPDAHGRARRRPRVPAERVRALLHHPRLALAFKAALAATLAWEIALRLPGPASDYPFYAPFGAIAMMYPTLASSVRQSFQSLAAIAVGALLGLVVDATLGAGILVVAVVVGVGMLLGGIRGLGEHRVYVPVAGLFVLVLGQGAELEYAAAYAGLFAMGALLAIAVNALLPPRPMAQVDEALAGLRTALEVHLTHLADRLDTDEEPDDRSPDRSGPGRPDLREPTDHAREVVNHAQDAVRANRRARRVAPGTLDAAFDAFRALERVSLLVDDVYDLLEDRPWETDLRRSTWELREPTAHALRSLVPTVLDIGVGMPHPGVRDEVEHAIVTLSEAVDQHRGSPEHEAEVLVVSTVVTNLRRCLSVLTPVETQT